MDNAKRVASSIRYCLFTAEIKEQRLAAANRVTSFHQ